MATWLQVAGAFSETIVEAARGLPISVRTVIGWPNPRQIENDLRLNTEDRAIISIYGLEATSVFRYISPKECIERFDATEELTILPDGYSVQLSGTLTPGDNVFLFINRVYDFACQVVLGSTANLVWMAIANKINAADIGVQANVNGDIIELIPDPDEITHLFSAAYGFGLAKVEVARPQRRSQITIWAPTPQIRDTLSGILMGALCRNNHYTLADGSIANVRFAGSVINDFHQSAGIFLEDLFYLSEYPVYAIDRYAIVGAIKGKLTTCFAGTEVIINDFLVFEKEEE